MDAGGHFGRCARKLFKLMIMRKYLYLLLSTLLLSASAFSQNEGRPGDGSRLEALKIAFITKKLNLTPDEARKFWPVYNQYSAEMRTSRIENRKNRKPELEAEAEVLNIRKKYNTEFSNVVGPEKTNLLYKSEKEFGNYVQKELSERRQSRPQHNNNR